MTIPSAVTILIQIPVVTFRRAIPRVVAVPIVLTLAARVHRGVARVGCEQGVKGGVKRLKD